MSENEKGCRAQRHREKGVVRARDDIMLSTGIFCKTVYGVTGREREREKVWWGVGVPRPPGGSESN